MTSRPEVDFDANCPAYAHDYGTILRAFHDQGPIAYSHHHDGFWTAVGRREVCDVALDDATFASHHDTDPGSPYGGILIPPSPVRTGIIEMDPPVFTQYRKMMNSFFTRSGVERMRPIIESTTDECVDRFIESGTCDLVLDLGSPVPAIVTMHLLGLPLDDWRSFADPGHKIAYVPQSSPEFPAVMMSVFAILDRIKAMIPQRRDAPGDDLLSCLCSGKVDGEWLPDDTILEIVLLLIAAGVDTSTSLLANILIHLQEHPEHRRQLIDQPDLRPAAIEEFLRYFSPVQGFARTVTRDVEVGGQTLKQWERIYISWAGANRDAAEFDRPDEVVLDRSPNRHVAFGIGIHRCLGARLAQDESLIMLNAVLDRLPDYSIDVDRAERYESIGQVNGWVTLPATFTPRPAACRTGSGGRGGRARTRSAVTGSDRRERCRYGNNHWSSDGQSWRRQTAGKPAEEGEAHPVVGRPRRRAAATRGDRHRAVDRLRAHADRSRTQ